MQDWKMQDWIYRDLLPPLENVGLDLSGPTATPAKCRTGSIGTYCYPWKMEDWIYRDQNGGKCRTGSIGTSKIQGVENAGLDLSGPPNYRGWKMQDWIYRD